MSEVQFQNLAFDKTNSEVSNPAAVDSVGGSLAASTTYYYKITTVTGSGETTGSSEVSDSTTAANLQITVSWTETSDPSSAVLYRIYRGLSSGVYDGYFEKEVGNTSFVDDGTTTLTSGAPPHTNLSAGTIFGVDSPMTVLGGYGDNVTVGLQAERLETAEVYHAADLQEIAVSNVGTSWVSRLSLVVDRASQSGAKTFIVMGTISVATQATTDDIGARITIDAAAYSETGDTTNFLLDASVTAGVGYTYNFIKRISLTAASHTVTLDYKTGSGTQDLKVRDASIVVWEEPTGTQSGESETLSSSGASAAELTKLTLTFTPSSTQDYLLMCYADCALETAWTTANAGFKFYHGATELASLYNTGSPGTLTPLRTVTNASRFLPVAAFKVINLANSSQSFTLTYQGASVAAEAFIKNARIYAVPLGSTLNYQAATEAETSTDSTTYATIITTSPSLQSGKHIALWYDEISNDSSTTYGNSRVKANGTANILTGFPMGYSSDSGADEAYYPQMRMYATDYNPGSTTFAIEGLTQTAGGSNTAIFRRNRILVIDPNRSAASTTYGEFKVKNWETNKDLAGVTHEGVLKLYGQTSGSVGLKGAAVAGSATYTLPSADGTSGYVLSTNGTGTLSWAAGGAPSDPTYVTLSTNATLTNERVLTGTANQIVITDGGAGAAVTLSTPQNIHAAATPTFGGMTLTAFSGAVSAAAGVLSAGTLSVANGGTGATSFTAGSIPVSNGTIFVQDNANLFFDDATERLGVGTNAPLAALHVTSAQPASVASTPGTAGTQILRTTTGTGGDTTIATTGTGGTGSAIIVVSGTGGQATAAATASTGGVGGVTSFTSGAGGAAAVVGAGANTGGVGGAVTFTSGAGGIASGGATNVSGAGGDVTFTSGAGGTGGSGGAAGQVRFTGGVAGGDDTANRQGGNFIFTGGASKGLSAGGGMTFAGGQGGIGTAGTGGGGGIASFTGGTGGLGATAGGNGGALTFTGGLGGGAGTSTTGGNGGSMNLNGGTGGIGATTPGTGGAVVISGGVAAAQAASNGGAATLRGTAGTSTTTGGNGGAATLAGGAAGGDDTVNRSGGAISITGGTSKGGTAGGAITATSGTGGPGTGVTGAAGGAWTATAGTGGSGSSTAGAGGTANFLGGPGGGGGVSTTGGSGGTAQVIGGAAGLGASSTGSGGTANLFGGTAAAQAGSAGGVASVQGRAGSSTGSGGAGGAVTIVGGAAGGDETVSRVGGSITLTAGVSVAGSIGGAISLITGAAGTRTISNNGAAGGAYTVTLGAGGAITQATGTNTGGNGGGVTFAGGAGGAVSGGTTTNTGGIGSAFSYPGGTGGAASGSASGANTGGAGGAVTWSAGTGGTGTNAGAGTSVGGAGGVYSITAGNGGVGGTTGGVGGALTLSAGNAAGAGNIVGGAVTINGGLGANSGAGGALIFQTATTITLAPRMTITAAGDVGIGETVPGGKVHVAGDIVMTGSANNRVTNEKILYGATTDAATAVELTTDGAAGSGTTNRILVPANSAMSIVVNICVKQSGSANAKQMLRQFLVSNNAGTTAIQGAVTTLGTDVGSAGLATVTTTITANDTDDAIKVEVNGVLATNLRYTAYVVSAETLYV